ncbi:MAG TPA: DUF72 domain-containing protein [Vulgatibacter sp.]
MARVHLGTSGWAYPHWRRLLYPEGMPERRWLARYAEVFATVEINATFYRLPSEKSVARWRDETPAGFVFACKGSRYLTHMKRLTEVGVGLDRFFGPLRSLGPKLGPVLWQLPAQWKVPDPARLARFLEHLPPDVDHVFEFRAVGWYVEEVLRILDAFGAALCEHDLLPPPPRRTGGFRYLRFHGSRDHGGRYGRSGLRQVARDLREAPGEAWVYFNNDLGGAALSDALDLSELLGERHPLVPLHEPA